jgi:hypothetical protein
MANIFKNKVIASIGTAPQGYTVPSNATATVIGMAVANRTASTITVDIEVVDTSATVTAYLVKAAIIAAGGSFVAVGGDQKVVLEQTDIIRVTSSTASSADVVISYMETT